MTRRTQVPHFGKPPRRPASPCFSFRKKRYQITVRFQFWFSVDARSWFDNSRSSFTIAYAFAWFSFVTASTDLVAPIWVVFRSHSRCSLSSRTRTQIPRSSSTIALALRIVVFPSLAVILRNADHRSLRRQQPLPALSADRSSKVKFRRARGSFWWQKESSIWRSPSAVFGMAS